MSSGVSKLEWLASGIVILIVLGLIVWFRFAQRTPQAPPMPPEVTRALSPENHPTTTPAISGIVLQKLSQGTNAIFAATSSSAQSEAHSDVHPTTAPPIPTTVQQLLSPSN